MHYQGSCKADVDCTAKWAIFLHNPCQRKIAPALALTQALSSAGIGFLFIIYTVLFELVMGIPYKKQSYVLGGSPTNNPLAAGR